MSALDATLSYNLVVALKGPNCYSHYTVIPQLNDGDNKNVSSLARKLV